ncbi:uncharacterized protein BXZ73DRAFT_106046 [Epithele typhae]|uniref:uncharacterized protein n=1 Tax=Epithele typhae TaxID=378194 RepID=UPI002007E92A|nr:uncharacterized protein BXZ73DRAFT_106046 [Epithele typhae]KAH9915765.1 hypothetical protein BXZ73DRAFT_106046 [Epithele typhae]
MPPKLGEQLRRCAGRCIAKPLYCSKECQKLHWLTHKIGCNNGPLAQPAAAPGRDPNNSLLDRLRSFTEAHEWALGAAAGAVALLTYGQDYGRHLETSLIRFLLAHNPPAPGARRGNPVRAFKLLGIDTVDLAPGARSQPEKKIKALPAGEAPRMLRALREFRAGERGDLARADVAYAMYGAEGPPAPDQVLIVSTCFFVEGESQSLMRSFMRLGVPRVWPSSEGEGGFDQARTAMEDLTRLCITSLNEGPCFRREISADAGLALPGTFQRREKAWVWRPLFTDWEEYEANPEKYGPMAAFRDVRSGYSPKELMIFTFLF